MRVTAPSRLRFGGGDLSPTGVGSTRLGGSPALYNREALASLRGCDGIVNLSERRAEERRFFGSASLSVLNPRVERQHSSS
jgi:hypothetical protein